VLDFSLADNRLRNAADGLLTGHRGNFNGNLQADVAVCVERAALMSYVSPTSMYWNWVLTSGFTKPAPPVDPRLRQPESFSGD